MSSDRTIFGYVYKEDFIRGLEMVKALLMKMPKATGITHESTLEDVYRECAMVGLTTLLMGMKQEGSFDEYENIVDLGNEVDRILDDLDH